MTTATPQQTQDAMEQVSREIEAEQLAVIQGAMDLFYDLADKIAAGQKPDTERVSSTLDESKQTLETLAAAVKLRRDRKFWVDMVAAAEKSKRKLDRLEAEIEVEVDRFAEVTRKHKQQLGELHAQLGPLQIEDQRAEEYRGKLGTTPLPRPERQKAQLSKEAEAQAALDVVKRKYQKLNADLGNHGSIRKKQLALGAVARQEQEKVDPGIMGQWKDQGSMKKNAAAAKKELAAYENEFVAPAEAELAKLPAEIKRLEKVYQATVAKRYEA